MVGAVSGWVVGSTVLTAVGKLAVWVVAEVAVEVSARGFGLIVV